MGIYFAGQEYTKGYAAGQELVGAFFAGSRFLSEAVTVYRATRTLDRTFGGGFPAWGGGNVGARAFNFEHKGERWRLYQVIPWDGPAIGGVNGNARIHIRNLDKNRGQNLLAEMPTSLRLSGADWTGLPWTFTRTTASSGFTNAGSGNTARKAVVYTADRANVGSSPADVGIAQGEEFTVELIFA